MVGRITSPTDNIDTGIESIDERIKLPRPCDVRVLRRDFGATDFAVDERTRLMPNQRTFRPARSGLFSGISNVGVLTEAKRPTCVITLYDEETKTISYRQVAQSAVADAIASSISFEVPLEDFGYRLDDDDFARRLGGMILMFLSGGSPFLKDHLVITANDAPGEQKKSP
jgi:hypothetical protein